MAAGLVEGKVALVTGASRGIGRAIAQTLADNGAVVYANARRAGDVDDLVNGAKAGAVIPVYFDVTDTAAAKQAVMRAYKEQGRLDVLVNNAGIMRDARIGMISHESILETFSVNVVGSMELLQYAARVMEKQRGGSIINMASIVGRYGNSGQLVYSATKGAVIAMTKTAAKELAQYHIRVNALAPGMIDTDMFRSIAPEHQQERLSKIGMGRIGTPEDVAKACLFLASDLSGYVTGQVLGVDGEAIV